MIDRRATVIVGLVLCGGLGMPLAAQEKPPAKSTQPPPPTSRPAKSPQDKGKAGAPAPKPPTLDPLARETLTKWQKLELHPGRAGLTGIACEVVVRSRGGMTGTWKATGSYRFPADADHPDGILTWKDDPDREVASALERRGWTAGAFSRSFRPAPLLHRLDGATVQGKARKNGTILAITGGGRKEGSFWLFDKAGVWVGSVVGPLRQSYRYETRVLDKQTRYVRTGSSYAVNKAKGEVTIWNREVEGFLMPVKIHEVVRVQGQVLSDLTFLFRSHRIQGPRPKSRPTAGSKAKKRP